MQYNPFCYCHGEDPQVEGLVESLHKAPLDVVVRRSLADVLEKYSATEEVSFHRRMADAIAANPDLGERIERCLAKANVGCSGRKVMTNWQGMWTTLQAIARGLFGESPHRRLDASGFYFGFPSVGPSNSKEVDEYETSYRGKIPVFLAVVRADGRVCVDGASVEKHERGWQPCPTDTAWPELAYPVPPTRGMDDPMAWSDCGQLYAPSEVWEQECRALLAPRLQAWAATR